MSIEARDNVIRKRFNDNVASPQQLNTFYPNAPFQEPEDGTWARLTIMDGDTTQESIGTGKRYRTPGVMTIQLFGVAGKGDKELKELADLIADLFRCVTDTGVRWRTPTVRTIGRDGKWWQINVVCPFIFDFIGA